MQLTDVLRYSFSDLLILFLCLPFMCTSRNLLRDVTKRSSLHFPTQVIKNKISKSILYEIRETDSWYFAEFLPKQSEENTFFVKVVLVLIYNSCIFHRCNFGFDVTIYQALYLWYIEVLSIIKCWYLKYLTSIEFGNIFLRKLCLTITWLKLKVFKFLINSREIHLYRCYLLIQINVDFHYKHFDRIYIHLNRTLWKSYSHVVGNITIVRRD